MSQHRARPTASEPAQHRQRTRRAHRKRSWTFLRPGIFLGAAAVVTAVVVVTQPGGPQELVLRSAGPTSPGESSTTLGAALAAPSTAATGPVPTSAGATGARKATETTGTTGTTDATGATRTTSTAGTTAPSAPSGVAMPVGDLPGWHQVFRDDFTTAVPPGSFPGTAYAARWQAFENLADAAGTGTYATSRITSVHGGELDVDLHTSGGHALVAAAIPRVGATGEGQTYGRYVVRYRADVVPGYSVAWVLWPDSNDWSDGEVDFPQGPAGGPISGSMRCPGAPTTTCLAAGTGATSAAWHTAAVEWTPSGTTFLLDGKQVAHSATTSSAPLHWVLQAQTGDDAPPAAATGHVLVDWVAVYRRS